MLHFRYGFRLAHGGSVFSRSFSSCWCPMLADAEALNQGPFNPCCHLSDRDHSLDSQSAPRTLAFAVGKSAVSVTPPLVFNAAVVASSNALPTAHPLTISTIQCTAHLGLDCRQKSCGDEQEDGDQSNTFDHQAMLADGGWAGKIAPRRKAF